MDSQSNTMESFGIAGHLAAPEVEIGIWTSASPLVYSTTKTIQRVIFCPQPINIGRDISIVSPTVCPVEPGQSVGINWASSHINSDQTVTPQVSYACSVTVSENQITISRALYYNLVYIIFFE